MSCTILHHNKQALGHDSISFFKSSCNVHPDFFPSKENTSDHQASSPSTSPPPPFSIYIVDISSFRLTHLEECVFCEIMKQPTEYVINNVIGSLHLRYRIFFHLIYQNQRVGDVHCLRDMFFSQTFTIDYAQLRKKSNSVVIFQLFAIPLLHVCLYMYSCYLSQCYGHFWCFKHLNVEFASYIFFYFYVKQASRS